MGPSSGLTLDPRREDPLYKQIFDQVVERILNGAFPPGYRLPPTRALAGELRTNRNTVVRAYVDLEAAGFVASNVGRGTFVMSHGSSAKRISAAPEAETLAWSSLLSHAATAETLHRSQQLVMRAQGTSVINLTRMQPSADMLPRELLRRCMDYVLRTRGVDLLSYGPPEGILRLRETIAADLVRQGVPATADDVVVTSGGQQALDLVFRALLNPGDLLITDPFTYSGALNLAGMAGGRVISMSCDAEGPELASLERLRRMDAKALYVMPNSNNPTGSAISIERRRALIQWARANSIPLIEDDYGADLELDGAAPPPALRAMWGDVIYIGSFSKRLIPALRVGFVLCPRGLRGTLAAMKHAMDLGCSPLLQHTLAEFLERGYLAAHLNRVLPEYRSRRDALEGALRKHLPRGVTFRHASHGVVLWLSLPTGIDPDRVFEEARRRGVLVTPSSLYAAGGRTEAGIRLAFCSESVGTLVEAARRLGEAMHRVIEVPRKTNERATTTLELV